MIGGLSVEMLLWTAGVPLVLAAVIKCVWSLLTTYSFCAAFRTVPQEPDFSWVWGNVHLVNVYTLPCLPTRTRLLCPSCSPRLFEIALVIITTLHLILV